MTNEIFTKDQLGLLKQTLDPRLTKSRPGGGRTLTYIGGHTAIDQANRIFGFDQWEFEVISCPLAIMRDPITGEGIGCAYEAVGKLTVNGKVIIEVGSQTVSPSSLEDCIMARRLKDVKGTTKPVDESEFTIAERVNARTTIMDAHENARKGAVTDAMKRAMRCYGDQFGNGLYGDGRIDLDITDEQVNRIQKGADLIGVEIPDNLHTFSFEEARLLIEQYTRKYKEAAKTKAVTPVQQPDAPKEPEPPASVPTPIQAPPLPKPEVKVAPVAIVPEDQEDKTPATEQQVNSIRRLREVLGKVIPQNEELTFKKAREAIQKLTIEYREEKEKREQRTNKATSNNKAS